MQILHESIDIVGQIISWNFPLLMKSMDIDKVVNFPFPTPFDSITLAEAERCLKALEVLNSKGRPTPLANAMTHYPFERNQGLPYLSYY